MNTMEVNTLPASVLVKSQKKHFTKTYFERRTFKIVVTVRYDDQCGNGHNTFAITADITQGGEEYMGGCCHDEVAKHFPELAPFIKWHLVSSDGPMHYPGNVLYHAGDRDHWGLKKGEFRQHTSRGLHQAGGVPGILHWELRLPKDMATEVYTMDKPAPVTLEWQPSGITGEGKAREFDHARSCAVWPDATEAELMAPDLKDKLLARLPALMAEFKRDVEALGFVY